MNRRILGSVAGLMLMGAAVAAAQDVMKMIPWEKLMGKAEETVDVNLEGGMLDMAKQFLSGADEEQAKIKNLVGNIKSIQVKSLSFKSEGEYSMADVEAIRSSFKSPVWSRVVDIKGKKETTGVYMKLNQGKVEGLVVVAAEPKELTIVNIVGSLKPEDLKNLGGNFGIPRMQFDSILPRD